MILLAFFSYFSLSVRSLNLPSFKPVDENLEFPDSLYENDIWVQTHENLQVRNNYNYAYSSVTIYGAQFMNCTSFGATICSNQGGAIYLYSSSLDGFLVYMTSNNAQVGGSISSIESNILLRNSTFFDNIAYLFGGAVYFQGIFQDNEFKCELVMISCECTNNLAHEAGGALSVVDSKLLYVDQCIFRYNKAKRRGGAGEILNTQVELYYSRFYYNEVDYDVSKQMNRKLFIQADERFGQRGGGAFHVTHSGKAFERTNKKLNIFSDHCCYNANTNKGILTRGVLAGYAFLFEGKGIAFYTSYDSFNFNIINYIYYRNDDAHGIFTEGFDYYINNFHESTCHLDGEYLVDVPQNITYQKSPPTPGVIGGGTTYIPSPTYFSYQATQRPIISSHSPTTIKFPTTQINLNNAKQKTPNSFQSFLMYKYTTNSIQIPSYTQTTSDNYVYTFSTISWYCTQGTTVVYDPSINNYTFISTSFCTYIDVYTWSLVQDNQDNPDNQGQSINDSQQSLSTGVIAAIVSVFVILIIILIILIIAYVYIKKSQQVEEISDAEFPSDELNSGENLDSGTSSLPQNSTLDKQTNQIDESKSTPVNKSPQQEISQPLITTNNSPLKDKPENNKPDSDDIIIRSQSNSRSSRRSRKSNQSSTPTTNDNKVDSPAKPTSNEPIQQNPQQIPQNNTETKPIEKVEQKEIQQINTPKQEQAANVPQPKPQPVIQAPVAAPPVRPPAQPQQQAQQPHPPSNNPINVPPAQPPAPNNIAPVQQHPPQQAAPNNQQPPNMVRPPQGPSPQPLGPNGQPIPPNVQRPAAQPNGRPMPPNAVRPPMGPNGQPLPPNGARPPQGPIPPRPPGQQVPPNGVRPPQGPPQAQPIGPNGQPLPPRPMNAPRPLGPNGQPQPIPPNVQPPPRPVPTNQAPPPPPN